MLPESDSEHLEQVHQHRERQQEELTIELDRLQHHEELRLQHQLAYMDHEDYILDDYPYYPMRRIHLERVIIRS